MIEWKKLVEIAYAAGNVIMEVYSREFTVEEKADKSPVTEADKRSDALIRSELKKYYPEIPVISEESELPPYEERKSWKSLFLVDPLDGTKEFIAKNGEFTVNIALVVDNKPVIGVVYAPAKKVCYYTDGMGSYMLNGEGNNRLPVLMKREKLVVVTSRSHHNDETKEFLSKLPEAEVVTTGSALKLCLIASGHADVYPRFGNTFEWDTAAGHAIVNGVGKKLLIYGTEDELTYNKEDLLNPWFVAL